MALWALTVLLFSILTHWALQWFLSLSETRCLKNKLSSDCVGLQRWQCLDSAWQVEQMRNELLQERASRQDLECDKIALERQVHTLLSRGGNKYTQCHTNLQQRINRVISLSSFHHFHWLRPSSHQFPVGVFEVLVWFWCRRIFLEIISRLFFWWPLQNKDLKSRLSHLEGSQKSNKEVLVAQLEERLQELEAKLEGEERWDKGSGWECRGGAPWSRSWGMKGRIERLRQKVH